MNDLDIHIDDGGVSTAAAPVVFLHSAAGDTSHFAAQLAHLRERRRAIAFDFRGHGRSAPPADGDYSIAGLAADVDRVAGGLALERFVVPAAVPWERSPVSGG